MKTTTHNTMTDDFGHEVTEARVLPLGGGANIITGPKGYRLEMANRRHMNSRNGPDGQWDLPSWESLRVYFPEPVAPNVPHPSETQPAARFGTLDR